MAETIWASELYEVHTVDRALEREAWRLLRKYADHRLSFTDGTTLALIEQLQIQHVFAFDEDFRRLGHSVVPESPR